MSSDSDKLEAFRVDPTLLGAVGGPPPAAGVPQPAPQAAETAGERPDAGYPTIEAICSRRKHVEAFAQRMQQTVGRLQEVAGSGTEAQREAAAKALRAFELLDAMLQRAVALTIEHIKRAKAAAGR